mgnify:CR=1 FL=1
MRRIFSTFIFMLLSCAVFAQTKAELYDRFSQAVSEHGEKLEGISEKWALKTVWGVGYKFEAEEEE